MKDPIKELIGHYFKTKIQLTTMSMGAAGWEAGVVNPENLGGPMVYLYLWDKPTDWTWLCGVKKSSFDQVVAKAKEKPDIWEAVRGGVAYLVHLAASGHPPIEWESELGLLLSAYAGTTQTLPAANGLPEGGHFIVCNYRPSQKGQNGKLRPLCIPGPCKNPLLVAELQQGIQSVLAFDQGRHPEWFK